jgi:hypothetical protein
LDDVASLVEVREHFLCKFRLSLPRCKSAVQFKLLLGKRDVGLGFGLSEVLVELELALGECLIGLDTPYAVGIQQSSRI